MNPAPTRADELPPVVGGPAPGRLEHQPALDGLRGAAVIAVLLFHDAFDRDPKGWISGGFLGVDAFFVLSGFLITSLLLEEHRHSDRIALGRFWSRRARRLLPALFVTLIGAAAYDFFVAPSSNLDELRRDAFATLGYIQNWNAIGANPLVTSPLSHTWSLSIEEQFYLLWPLLLVVLIWRTRRDLSKILGVAIAMICASAGTMAWLYAYQSRDRAYYGTDARAQALMVGVALALVVLRRRGGARRNVSRAVEMAGVGGGAFLLCMFVRASPDDAFLFRGGFFLVALATAGVIAASVQPAGVIRRALSARMLTSIGLISYGLYLYHWPLYLVLTPERVHIHGYPLLLVRSIATVAIATASYFLLEKPIRRGAIRGWRMRIATPVSVIVLVAIITAATVGSTAASGSSKTLFAYRQLAADAPANAVKVLVAGDAVVDDLSRASRGPYTGHGIFGATISTAPCGIVGGSVLLGKDVSRATPCPPFGDTVSSAVEGFVPDVTVLMIGRSEVFDRVVDGRNLRVSTYDYGVYLLAQLERARTVLTANGARMVLATVPCTDPPANAPLRQIVGDQHRIAWLNVMLRRFAADHPDSVTLADVNNYLCEANAPRHIPGFSVFGPDGVSLTEPIAQAVWAWLAPIATSLVPASG